MTNLSRPVCVLAALLVAALVTGFEAIGWFYGTETVRDWRGESRVNLFARVDQSEWPFLEEVGLRTWREGGEDCTISVVED